MLFSSHYSLQKQNKKPFSNHQERNVEVNRDTPNVRLFSSSMKGNECSHDKC